LLNSSFNGAWVSEEESSLPEESPPEL